MKRYGIIIPLFFILTLTAAWMAGAGPHTPTQVSATKHNLSTSGTGTYKSDVTGGTTEICVFCHTPHGGNTDAPLWNRSNSANSITPYTSDVMSALSYTGDSSLGTGQLHVKTRICLSCHDGTIAMGKLVNLPYGLTEDIPILNAPGGQMPTGAAGYIGVDLSDDHPVAIVQDNIKDRELRMPPTAGVNVKLYYIDANTKAAARNPAQNGDYVECTSCHDAHDNYYGNFLSDSNAGSQICTSCHNKETGGVVGAHDNSSAGYNPNGSAPGTPTFIGDKVGGVSGVKCMNCHYPHRAGATGAAPPWSKFTSANGGWYLLTFQEENACFNQPNRWGNSTNVCHGSGAPIPPSGGRDIQTDVNRTSAHRVGDQAGRHGAVEVRAGTLNGWFTSGVWHVECEDCHNPHTAGTGVHTQGTNTIDTTSSLYGVSYVRVSGAYPSGVWVAPTLYTPVEPLGATTSNSWATDVKEYEICFKCHSYFATAGGAFPNAPSNGLQITDQSKEFNSNAPTGSFHPVVTGNPNTYGAYVNGWTSGNQLMYCSDCHTKENNVRPQGAHGSTNSFILSKQYFDDKANYGSSDDSASTFCMDCHDSNTYVYGGTGTNTGFSGGGVNLHTQHALRAFNHAAPSTFAYRCVNCHIRIPHGWQQRKGMIFVQGDAPGAMYAPVSGPTITWANLAGPTGYAYTIPTKNTNCMTINGCH